MLIFNEADLAPSLKLLNQCARRFRGGRLPRTPGRHHRNLGIPYSNLGLYRRARRLLAQGGRASTGRTGAHSSRARHTARFLPKRKWRWGISTTARAYIAEVTGMANAHGRPAASPRNLPRLRGRLALRRGRCCGGAAAFRARGEARARTSIDAADANRCLAEIGEPAWRSASRARRWTATRRATGIASRARPGGTRRDVVARAASGGSTARRWRPTSRRKAAREALEIGVRFMSKGIASLSDEGLRRNYLNKIDDAPRDRRARGSRTRAGAGSSASGAPRTSRARRACASRSSGWSTPACA